MFFVHYRENNQQIQYCGVNAHHKNAVVEQNIITVSECMCSMLIYIYLHWKNETDSSLWSMDVNYVIFIYNHLSNERDIATADLLTSTQITHHNLNI